jgi:hypothetical protein
MGKLVSSCKSSTSSTGSSSTTLDSDKSKTKGRSCGFKNFSEEELSTLVQMVDKFKPARRDQLNFGWKLSDGETCRNRFDRLIPKQKPTGSTEVPDNTSFVEPC